MIKYLGELKVAIAEVADRSFHITFDKNGNVFVHLHSDDLLNVIKEVRPKLESVCMSHIVFKKQTLWARISIAFNMIFRG